MKSCDWSWPLAWSPLPRKFPAVYLPRSVQVPPHSELYTALTMERRSASRNPGHPLNSIVDNTAGPPPGSPTRTVKRELTTPAPVPLTLASSVAQSLSSYEHLIAERRHRSVFTSLAERCPVFKDVPNTSVAPTLVELARDAPCVFSWFIRRCPRLTLVSLQLVAFLCISLRLSTLQRLLENGVQSNGLIYPAAIPTAALSEYRTTYCRSLQIRVLEGS